MIDVRRSPDKKPNPDLVELEPRKGERNQAWLKRAGIENGVLLLGGCSLVEFRIRVAQSQLRQDLLPSFWSLAGLLCGGASLYTVADVRDLNDVPASNGVQRIRVREIDDPDSYPNIAVLQFTEDHGAVERAVEAVRSQRSLLDVPTLIVPWLAYAWGAAGQGNPLREGRGLPSASLVATAHALVGVDLTPGLASEASCPEAIWQAAKWWTGYYTESAQDPPTGAARARRPRGRYACRQPEAHVRTP